MSRNIRAGRAFVELFADKEKLERDLRMAEATVRSFGQNVQTIGRQFLTIGALAAVAILPAISIYAGFTETMSAVKAVSGATGEEFEELTEKARELGATTSFSAKEVAAGMKYLGMAGYETQQILEGIPAVLNLAKAGAVELGIASDIASDVSSAFGLMAKDITRVADVMAATATKSNTSIEGLGESFKFAAPAGHAAGQVIEDVSAALGTLGSSGLKGSIAGRNLQIMFKQLASNDVQAKLKKMNVEVADAQGNFRDLSEIMLDLRRPLQQLSEVERVRFLNDVFGESAKAAQILIAQAPGFRQLRTELDAAAGSAEDMAQTMGDNLAGDWKNFISAVQEAAIALIGQLEPALRGVLQTVTEAIRGIGEWIENNRALIEITATAVVALGGIGVALTATGVSLQIAAGGVGMLQKVLLATTSALSLFSSRTDAATLASSTFANSQKASAAAAAASTGTFFAATNRMSASVHKSNAALHTANTSLGSVSLSAKKAAESYAAMTAAAATANKVTSNGTASFFAATNAMSSGATAATTLATATTTATSSSDAFFAAQNRISSASTQMQQVIRSTNIAFTSSANTTIRSANALLQYKGAGITLQSVLSSISSSVGSATNVIKSSATAVAGVLRPTNLLSGAMTALRGTLSGVGVVLRTLGPLFAGLIIFEVAKSIYASNAALKDFNRELEKSAKLTERLNRKKVDRQQNILQNAAGLSGQERQDYLTKQIETARKELAGLQASLKGAEKNVDDLNTAYNRWTGNKILEAAQVEMEETSNQLEQQKDFIEDLIGELARNQDLIDDEQLAADLQAIEERQQALEAFASSVTESIKTPQEEFEEFMQQLQEAFAAGLIDAEEFRRAAEQQQGKLDEIAAREQKERDAADQEVRDQARTALEEQIHHTADLARARKDFLGEMNALAEGATQARRSGFLELAEDLTREQLEKLTSQAATLEEQYRDSLESSDLVTSSASQALFGLGQETVDQQALEQAKAQRLAAERAAELLESIKQELEG